MRHFSTTLGPGPRPPVMTSLTRGLFTPKRQAMELIGDPGFGPYHDWDRTVPTGLGDPAPDRWAP